MKKVIAVITTIVCCQVLIAADITVKHVKGKAEIQSGVAEGWVKARAGTALSPESTIKTGRKSSLTILADGKRLVIPELTLVDVGDLRQMPQEELLLKLAMSDVRVAPPRDESDGSTIPNTTIVHGKDMAVPDIEVKNGGNPNQMEVRGTELLYKYGFYATCILRAKETMVYSPELKSRFGFRYMIAKAFEKMRLKGEALGEYVSLAKERLSSSQRKRVENDIRRLKQQ
jgi:hypothetical protein